MNNPRFRRFSAIVIVATLGVILWGAYVRATGSGAGCGSHWPTCNGEVIPRDPSRATMIEFTHRATSGIAFLLVVAQTVWAFRAYPRRHGVRRAAAASLLFMVTEAIVGAGLVIFEMVAGNTSTARAAWMAAHLMNTFVLLAAMGLTWWRARVPEPITVPAGASAKLVPALAGTLIVAMSGAVAALGDTLFPAATLREGLAQDLSSGAHLFIRLRVLHPPLAVGVGLYLLVITASIAARAEQRALKRMALVTLGLVAAQLVAGFVNLLLAAPVAMQVLHLLLADMLWLALVVLASSLRARATDPASSAALATA